MTTVRAEGQALRSGRSPRIQDDVGFLLSRASGLAVRTTNNRLEQHGLRVRQYSVLVAVAETGERSQRDVAELLALDPSQIVVLVDELERDGLVERRPHPTDRRTRLVSPTARGRSLVLDAERSVRQSDEEYLHMLNRHERLTLARLLRQVNGLDGPAAR